MTSTLSVTPMWVNESNQGTAMAETALCDACQHSGDNALTATLLAMQADDFDRTRRTRVENPELTCQVCGTAAQVEVDF